MSTIRNEREKQKLSLRDVAEALDLSTAAVGHWELGVRAPEERDLRRYLKFLGLSVGLVDDWIEERIEQEVARALESRRGPRAMASEDVEAIRRIVRRSWNR